MHSLHSTILFLSLVILPSSSLIPNHDTEWGSLPTQTTCPKPQPFPSSSSSEEQTEIAIIGGGLSGLALAIGLHHHLKIPIQIYERAPQLRSNSQGMLGLFNNGMTSLEQIHPELSPAITNSGCELLRTVGTSIKIDGSVEEIVNESKNLKAIFGRYPILIQWHALQQVLASFLPPEIVKTNKSLVSFEEDSDSVLLKFEDGSKVRCKAAIACDGTFSVVRRQILPNDPILFFGQLNWNSIVPTDSLPPNLHPSNAVRVISHIQKEPKWTVFLNDCGDHHTFFQLRLLDPKRAMSLSGNKGRGGLGLPGVKSALMSIAECSDDVSKALRHIPESQIFERCIVGRNVAKTWRSRFGRVALLGDAAHGMHPNIGQGANSAFESVWVALKALKECEGDWKEGLEIYEERRKWRADLVQRYANMMGCAQFELEKFISKEVRGEMTGWIHEVEGGREPPEVVVDVLEGFDPLKQPGVTILE